MKHFFRTMLVGCCAIAAQAHAADSPEYLQTRAKLIGMMERDIPHLLRDPRGVMFRSEWVRLVPNGAWLCGEINARNAFGGYTGYQPFAAFVRRDGVGGVNYLFILNMTSTRLGSDYGQWQEYCLTPEEREKASADLARKYRQIGEEAGHGE